jgi:chromosome segregation ATPase
MEPVSTTTTITTQQQQQPPVKTPLPSTAVKKIDPTRKTLPVNLYTPQGPATNRTISRTTSILQDTSKKSNENNYLMTRNYYPLQTPKKAVDTTDLLSMQKLKISNQTLEKQVGNMMKTIESETVTSKLNSMKILKLEEQVRNLMEDNKGLVSQRAILQKEIKDLKLKLASKQRSALEVKLKNMQYECEKSSVQSEEVANTMKAQIEQLKENLGNEIGSLTKERDKLIKDKDLIGYKLNETQKSFLDSNNTVIILQEERNKLKEQSDHLESKNIQLTSHYELLKSDYDKLLGENHSIKNQMDLLQSDKDNLISSQHNEVNRSRLEISKLQLNLESSKIEISKKDQKIEHLTHELKTSQSKTETLQKEMDQTLSKLLKETSDLSHLTDQYRLLSNALESLKGELTLAKHESSQYQTHMEDLRLRLKTLQMDLEKSQKDKLQNTSDLQIVRSDLDRLTLITNHLKEEKQISQQEICFFKNSQ